MNKTIRNIPERAPGYGHSRGAILIVSLILLLVMTLVGIAATDSTTLQSQMARNSLFAQTLYQKSRSEIEAQLTNLEDTNNINKVVSSKTVIDTNDNSTGILISDTNSETYDPNDPYEQSGNLKFVGDSSLVSGYSIGIVIGKDIQINAKSVVPGTGSVSDQTQGGTFPAPASEIHTTITRK